MLDHKLYTFLKLCDLMNYRATAEALNMTQPAVTQHIQRLEQEYQCKLFTYNNKKLYKTTACEILESYAQSARCNELAMRQRLLVPDKITLHIGATKTIGDYVIPEKILSLANQPHISFSLIVDNTEHLLHMLEHSEIHIAFIEGFFDKHSFGYQLYRKERFVGICAEEHPFAGKDIEIRDLFSECIICREKGSGTREIFEQILHENNFSLEQFHNSIDISSFELIKNLVKHNAGISFVYEAIAKSDPKLRVFHLKGTEILREFNIVYLKDTYDERLLSLLT